MNYDILREKKLYIFDMDGTIYLGNRVFDFAVNFIKKLRENGKRVLFFTNNASKSPSIYYERLERMGFEVRDGEVLTSGDVTIKFLKSHRAGKPVYLVGTPALEKQFDEAGIVRSENADIVITSFDTTLTYEKLNIACRLVRNGAEYLSTHPDFNCPTEDGFIPDSGAISAFVTASTGVEPVYFGKPYPATVEMIEEFTGMKREDMVVFGDRLYTDIALGKKNGMTAVLVYTGETTKEDIAAADEKDRPDFIFDSLADVSKIVIG